MLDSKLQYLINHFAISKVQDWCAITPAQLLAHDGIGHKTVNYLRVLLASHGFTLKDDRTPEFWKKNLPDVQIVDSITDREWGQDAGVVCPFVVLVDPAEQMPFTFQGMRADSDLEYRPLIVPTESTALGRGDTSLGDYSLSCGVGRCHVERKSMKDAHGTILGFNSGRRERFEKELANLSELVAGLVVVECSLGDLIRYAPKTDHRDEQANAKILNRSILSFMQEYKVPWIFADDRRHAEHCTFRWLWRFYEKQEEAAKRESKQLKRLQAPPQKQPAPVNASGTAASVASESVSEAVASLF